MKLTAKLRTALAWYRLRLLILWLNLRNRTARGPGLGSANVAVSLTTHGKRLETVHLAIESILAGSLRPRRLVLWLDSDPATLQLPAALLRLQARGLDIRFVDNFGPHTKYFPYVRQFDADDMPLVTADDDVLYPRAWLAQLVAAHAAAPAIIHCHLARRIALGKHAPQPYQEWLHATSTTPSHRTFALGYAGVIYPPAYLATLRAADTAFMQICPKNDDIWLHATALRNGYLVHQLTADPAYPLTIPFTQDVALFNSNQLASGNDAQAQAVYTAADVDTMARSA